MIIASKDRDKGWYQLRLSVRNFEAFRGESDIFRAVVAASDSDFTLIGQGTRGI